MASSFVIIDIGASRTVIANEQHGIFYDEPNALLLRKRKKWYGSASWEVEAIGQPAVEKLQKGASARKQLISPIQQGQITEGYWLKKMLEYALIPVNTFIIKPRIGLLLPYGLSKTTKKHVLNIVKTFGVPTLLDPALMVSAGVKDEPNHLPQAVLYLGFAQTWLTIHMMGEQVVFKHIPLGGYDLDTAIVQYVKERHLVEITHRQAEQIKWEIGSVYPMASINRLKVKGKSVKDGHEKEIKLDDHEIRDVLLDAMEPLLLQLTETLAALPLEVVVALSNEALSLIGGGANLSGIAQFIKKRLKFPCSHSAEPPEHITVLNALHWMRAFSL